MERKAPNRWVRRDLLRRAFLAGLLVASTGAWGLPRFDPRFDPKDGAAPARRSLCELLTQIQPGEEQREVVVSGVLESLYEVTVLYDPAERLCEYDVQPDTAVAFARSAVLGEDLDRILGTEGRARVTVRGTLSGPPPVPEDSPSELATVTTLQRVAKATGYGHFGWSRTQLEVEEVVQWERVSPSEPGWGPGARARSASAAPIVVSAAVPTYPRFALFSRVSGDVVVAVVVQEGKVVETEVLSGDRMLVPDVLANIATWTLEPTAKARFTSTFHFELELRKSGADPNPRIELNLPTSAKIVARLRAR